MVMMAACAFALASCSSNEVATIRNDGQQELGFGVYAPKMQKTRADVSNYVNGNTVPVGGIFVVYGYNQGNGDFDASTLKPEFMNNVDVTFGGNDTYTYSPKRYWPSDEDNNKLAFYAYYPKNDHVSASVDKANPGLGSFKFTVDTIASKQADFMISDLKQGLTYSNAKAKTKSDRNGQVKLTFRHKLTKVRFAAKTTSTFGSDDATTKISIDSIYLKGIKTTGTLTPSYYKEKDSTITTWSNLGDPKNIAVSGNSGALADTVSSKEDSTSTMLMIPQELGDDAYVVITYTVQTGDDALVVNTVPVLLKDIIDTKTNKPIDSWDQNKNILYTFIIDLKDRAIEFSAQVIDWEETISTGEIKL